MPQALSQHIWHGYSGPVCGFHVTFTRPCPKDTWGLQYTISHLFTSFMVVVSLRSNQWSKVTNTSTWIDYSSSFMVLIYLYLYLFTATYLPAKWYWYHVRWKYAQRKYEINSRQTSTCLPALWFWYHVCSIHANRKKIEIDINRQLLGY